MEVRWYGPFPLFGHEQANPYSAVPISDPVIEYFSWDLSSGMHMQINFRSQFAMSNSTSPTVYSLAQVCMHT
jgi:hypothetical protein